jgi:hypothetical protein
VKANEKGEERREKGEGRREKGEGSSPFRFSPLSSWKNGTAA